MTGSGRRRNSLVAFVVGAGSVILSPGLSQAQVPGGGIPGGGIPGGGAPATGGKRLRIDVIGDILYDSNLTKGRDTVVTARNLHKSDVTYSPGVDVKSFLPLGRNILFLNGTAGYDFHHYNQSLDSWRADLTGGGVARLGRCEVNLVAGYELDQSDLADLPLQVTRNRQTTRTIGTQATCAAGAGLIGFVGAQAADTSNSADFNVVDSDTVSFNGGFGYGNKRLGTLQIIGGYTKTDYERSDNPTVVLQPGFEAYNVGLRYSRAIGNRLNGNASIGYQEVHSESALEEDSSNLTGSGQLDYRLNNRIGLTLAYDRSAAPTIIEGYNYILDQTIRFEGRYSMSSRLQTTLGARWNKTDYKGREGPVLLDIPTKERIRSLFGTVTMKLGRTASVGLNASQEKRTSEPEVFDYTAYQVGVTAKKSF